MTIDEAKEIIRKTKSPYLKRDMEKFIKSEKAKRKSFAERRLNNAKRTEFKAGSI